MKPYLTGMALALTLGTASVARAQDATVLNFGIISTESQQNLKTLWDPFLDDMAKETGLDIKPFFASDYAGVIEAMRFGKVDVAWYGNKSAMEAVDRADGEIFAQTVDVSGNPGYWSLLITQADSPLKNVEDVLDCSKGLNFGLGDPNSTSGFLVPTTFVFAANGVDPKQCYKRVTNANHETNALAVANGQVDFATNNTESMARLQETNPDAYAKIKEIWRSPLIPSDPLVWRKDLDKIKKDEVMTFFMTYGRLGDPSEVKADRKVLADLGWAPFQPSSNAQLYPIRLMENAKETAQLQAETKMSEEDKEARMKELEAQKAEIEGQMAEMARM